MKLEYIYADERWYVCKGRYILTLKKNREDAEEFARLYKGYAKRYNPFNQLREAWRWLTLIFF